MPNKSFLLFALFVTLTFSFTIQNSNQLEQKSKQVFVSSIQSVSLRLHPNQDIIKTITQLISPFKFSAVSVSSAVGSVNYCWLRLANNSFLSKVEGPFEITSLVGTFDKNLQPHIHIQLADGNGDSIGGHLPSLDERKKLIDSQNEEILNQEDSLNLRGLTYDCPIFTTLELVLLSHNNIVFERKVDPETTFHELFISRKRNIF